MTNQGNCHGPPFEGLCAATVIAGSAVVFREAAGKRERRWFFTADIKITIGSFVNSQSTMCPSTKSEDYFFLLIPEHSGHIQFIL